MDQDEHYHQLFSTLQRRHSQPVQQAPAPAVAPARATQQLHNFGQVAPQGGAAPRQPGFFERHIWGPHHYRVEHQANTRRPDESDEELTQRTYDAMVQHPAPGAMGRASTEEGRRMLIPLGFINTMAHPERRAVTNVTVPPHLLHPGDVERTAQGENIVSEGGGHGLFPSLNERLAPALWGSVAHTTRLRTDPDYARQFEEMRNRLPD